MGKLIIGVVLVGIAVVWFVMRDTPNDTASNTMDSAQQKAAQTADGAKSLLPAKEFAMTAYYDDKGVWYSLKEMQVKKGDLVRVKVTNTKGMHDFVIDELGIKKELPLNEEVVIEFTANTAGTFEYYCSKPGHRAKGQWGKLIVTE